MSVWQTQPIARLLTAAARRARPKRPVRIRTLLLPGCRGNQEENGFHGTDNYGRAQAAFVRAKRRVCAAAGVDLSADSIAEIESSQLNRSSRSNRELLQLWSAKHADADGLLLQWPAAQLASADLDEMLAPEQDVDGLRTGAESAAGKTPTIHPQYIIIFLNNTFKTKYLTHKQSHSNTTIST